MFIMKKIIVYLLLLLFLISCSSGKKAYERGDYLSAVIKAVNHLRSNPNHQKSKTTLEKAYPAALQFFNNRIEISKSSNDEFKWGQVVESMESVNTMYEQINRCPECKKMFPQPQLFTKDLNSAREKAAEETYKAGVKKLQIATLSSAREAYNLFRMTEHYMPNYKDCDEKIEVAKEMAT